VKAWLARRRRQRRCWHHLTHFDADTTNMAADTASWIIVVGYVDGGRRAFRCDEKQGGCGRLWLS
jgi:hypothetical protein